MIADVGVGLRARADVGADTAIVKKIDRGAEDCLDQRLAVERVAVASESGARLRTELDSLLAAREDAAAGADERGIVVGPGGAREIVESFAFVEAGLRIRIRIDEDVPMVEGGD
jgi:hypothetical protein